MIEFMSEHAGVVVYILLGLFGIVGWFARNMIVNLVKRVDHLESNQQEMKKDISDMKLNYITRFSEASEHRNSMKEELLKELAEIKICIKGLHPQK